MIRREEQPPDRHDESLPALDPYLDGRLGPAACAAVQRSLATDPELRAAHDASREIDRSIARVLGIPAGIGVAARPAEAPSRPAPLHEPGLEPAAPRRSGGARRWLTIVGAAGAIAAAIAIANTMFVPGRGRVGAPSGATAAMRDPAALYVALVSEGFQPLMKCENDAEFARYTAEQYGESFMVEAAPDVEILGWAYGREVGGMDSGLILATVESSPVLVLVGRRKADRGMSVPASSGLRVHRRELGEVVLYELTPRETAGVIPAAKLVETAIR